MELGGGFGGLSYYLCTHFGVSVHACDLSVEHEVYSKEHFNHENKTFEIIDYRDFLKRHIREGTPLFDRVVSVGMMEHVGPRNFPNFFRQIRKVIKPQGLFLLHTIGNSVDDRNQDPWFEKYVFPGACIPGPQPFFQPGCIGDGWKLEDWHNFGVDYMRAAASDSSSGVLDDPTLEPPRGARRGDVCLKNRRTCMAWRENAFAARAAPPSAAAHRIPGHNKNCRPAAELRLLHQRLRPLPHGEAWRVVPQSAAACRLGGALRLCCLASVT